MSILETHLSDQFKTKSIFNDVSSASVFKCNRVEEGKCVDPREEELKIKLVVKNGCPACEKAIENFKPEIESKKIELVEVSNPEFNVIKEQLSIKYVPACVIENTKEKKYYYCSKDEEEKQKD